jgi:hypothetical protein
VAAEGTDAIFTAEEVCAQARGNGAALLLALVAAAHERGEDLVAAARVVGRWFAPSWDELRGAGALAVTRMASLNLVTAGADLRALAGDARRAEATLTGWPAESDLTVFGLSKEDADAAWQLYAPIANHLGLCYAWRRDGETITLAFAHGTGDPA